MFGYNYGIKEYEDGNKILEISINLNYISMIQNIPIEDVEAILDNYNPVGILHEKIKEIHNQNF